jgi:hypothetical protein
VHRLMCLDIKKILKYLVGDIMGDIVGDVGL